ncbi:MAG: LamG domain-containing protein [Acidimicrobiales bacterium]|nr:LamG domain-containing protein [Acidimicrobiales bacterium]
MRWPAALGGRTTRRRAQAVAVSLSLLAAASAVVGSGDEPAESVTVTIPGCVVQPADILGWWRGEDDLLAEVGPDLSGSTGFENGVIRRGMTFDGTGTAAVDGFPAVSTGVTVEAWIRPVVTGQIQSLFSRWTWVGGENDDAFALFIGPNSDLFWTTDEITTRAPESLSVPVPQLFDGWYHHVAATWDATTMTIYLDGLPVGSKRSQGGVLNAAPTTQFRVGSSSGPGAPFTYQGGIDEPTVYGRALTAAEIDGIVAAGPKAKCAEDPPAVATAYVAGPGPVAAETPADAGGVDPVLTPDGRHVVFRTRSTDVVPVVTDPATQTPGQDYDMFSPDHVGRQQRARRRARLVPGGRHADGEPRRLRLDLERPGARRHAPRHRRLPAQPPGRHDEPGLGALRREPTRVRLPGQQQPGRFTVAERRRDGDRLHLHDAHPGPRGEPRTGRHLADERRLRP